METIRQGDGYMRTVSGEAPTTREDGTPLPLNEIAHYNFYVKFNDGPVSPPAAVLLVDGAFSEQIDIDAHEPGTYEIYYTTVDTQVPPKESVPSNSLILEILEPFKAAPNPPSGVS